MYLFEHIWCRSVFSYRVEQQRFMDKIIQNISNDLNFYTTQNSVARSFFRKTSSAKRRQSFQEKVFFILSVLAQRWKDKIRESSEVDFVLAFQKSNTDISRIEQ